MSDAGTPPVWLADPTVTWSILLVADLADPPPEGLVGRALGDLNARLGVPGASALVAARGDALLPAVAGPGHAGPIVAGLDGRRLVLGGHHQYVDGLGMLTVLTELTGLPASSSARGLAPRSSTPSFADEVRRRLTEVVVAPPARVARTGSGPAASGSAFARLALDRRVGVTDLVHAAASGLVAFNAARSTRTRRVAVAVGASTTGGSVASVADHSALLRLRSAELATKDEIRTFLREAPVVPSPGQSLGDSRPWVTRAAAVGLRLLGPRLGSTLTVSHLGDVTSPAAGLTFYPVGAASGVALGAVTQDGRTTVTARGQADRHSRSGLEALLACVADAIT